MQSSPTQSCSLDWLSPQLLSWMINTQVSYNYVLLAPWTALSCTSRWTTSFWKQFCQECPSQTLFLDWHGEQHVGRTTLLVDIFATWHVALNLQLANIYRGNFLLGEKVTKDTSVWRHGRWQIKSCTRSTTSRTKQKTKCSMTLV